MIRKSEFDSLKNTQDLIKTDNVQLFQILDEMNGRLKHIEDFLAEEFGTLYKRYLDR